MLLALDYSLGVVSNSSQVPQSLHNHKTDIYGHLTSHSLPVIIENEFVKCHSTTVQLYIFYFYVYKRYFVFKATLKTCTTMLKRKPSNINTPGLFFHQSNWTQCPAVITCLELIKVPPHAPQDLFLAEPNFTIHGIVCGFTSTPPIILPWAKVSLGIFPQVIIPLKICKHKIYAM